ncbi:MAG: LCP family protein [Candidatus Blackburnbacteria bacterium]|nr:LCP family protein [Candidatus Blackburnbacteria bacterium]
MGKLYHGLGLLLVLLLLFFAPLLKYIPQTAGLARDFLFGAKNTLRSQDGRTNILILGLGGPKNEPSGLTDTIIFFSIDSRNQNPLLLSLPRDIWIPQMRAKLNTAYYYGNRAEGVGMEWAKGFVSEIVGQPVHYTVVLSFEGFVKIVDLLGGINIDVERAFVDTRYPVPGKEGDPCGGDPQTLCRFETVSFGKGMQYFDGATALKFARSRNAEGEEGTDFARAARQQKVILALKEKVLSPPLLFNPRKVSQMISFITQSLETDIPRSHFGPLARLILNMDKGKLRLEIIAEENIKNGRQGFLVNPPISSQYDKQWVLVPKAVSWEETQKWVVCLLTKGNCPIEETSNSR